MVGETENASHTEKLTLPPRPARAAPPPEPAGNGKLRYDPSTCSRDPQGMVYFAVGRRVLRQPMDNLTYMLAFTDKHRLTMPHPRHPEEPEGCPDHPIQQEVYHLRRVSAMPGDPPNAASSYADRLSLIIHNGDIPNSRNGLFEFMCNKFTLRDYTMPEFIGCKKPYHCNESVTYQATDYAEPNGTKLALFCDEGPKCTGELTSCDGGYLLHDHFTVNFGFEVSVLPIEHFIAADQEVRRRFDAAEISDFEWLADTNDTKSGDIR